MLKELAISEEIPYNLVRDLFTIYVAHYILYRIRKAVKEQKISGRSMKSTYKPLNPKYKRTKPKETRNKFWIKNDILIRKLGVYMAGKNRAVYIGFRGNKRFISSQDKVKFVKTLHALEYGSRKKNIPPRPLVRPIMISTRKNITWLYKRFEKDIRIGTLNLKSVKHSFS